MKNTNILIPERNALKEQYDSAVPGSPQEERVLSKLGNISSMVFGPELPSSTPNVADVLKNNSKFFSRLLDFPEGHTGCIVQPVDNRDAHQSLTDEAKGTGSFKLQRSPKIQSCSSNPECENCSDCSSHITDIRDALRGIESSGGSTEHLHYHIKNLLSAMRSLEMHTDERGHTDETRSKSLYTPCADSHKHFGDSLYTVRKILLKAYRADGGQHFDAQQPSKSPITFLGKEQ